MAELTGVEDVALAPASVKVGALAIHPLADNLQSRPPASSNA
ncbi:hypothetical protein [Streptosporangium subroseum]|nr:hypothetical protein [Streptosporangium subroseum]